MGSILCVGRAVWDFIFSVPELPLAPGKVCATEYREAGGGPAMTAAVAIARLGGNAEAWSVVGDDSAGRSTLNDLARYGVDTKNVCIVKGAMSPVSAVLVAPDGERAIAAFRNADIHRHVTKYPDALPPSTSMILADTGWPELTGHMLQLARALGVPAVLDVEESEHPKHREIVSQAQYPVFSHDGLISFTGQTDLEPALEEAAKICAGTVCVTMGSGGCFWVEHGDIKHQPAFAVHTVDTTGAGDVFHGALALALSQGMDFAGAARLASGAAALKCTLPGGRAGIPDRNTLDKFLDREANG